MPHAIRIHEHGDAAVLRWEAVDLPPPGPGEVRLRQTAVGLNYIDIYILHRDDPDVPDGPDRRTVLKWMALAAAAPAVGGCGEPGSTPGGTVTGSSAAGATDATTTSTPVSLVRNANPAMNPSPAA